MRWTIDNNNNIKHLLNNWINRKRVITGGYVSELQYTLTLKQDYHSFENWMFHFEQNRQGNIPRLLVSEGRKCLIYVHVLNKQHFS